MNSKFVAEGGFTLLFAGLHHTLRWSSFVAAGPFTATYAEALAKSAKSKDDTNTVHTLRDGVREVTIGFCERIKHAARSPWISKLP